MTQDPIGSADAGNRVSANERKGDLMKTRIGIILLSLVVLAGCNKKEDAAQASKSEDTAAPAMSAAATDSGAETTMAAVPTKLGDAAYPLTGLTWVKGSPVTIAPGKVYVVEFWATWCPPCRESIPHLTKLAKKYADNVVFVGVSNEEVSAVKPFVAEKGDEMNYHVAVDTTDKVANGYMTAFDQGGIPTAFIVNTEGKVVWLGHPMDLDNVLGQVVAGTYTIPG